MNMNRKVTLVVLISLIISMLLVGCFGSNNNASTDQDENGEINNGSAQGKKEVFRIGLEADYAPFN